MNSPTPKLCPQCSQPIPLESQFCPFCGVRITTQSVPPASPARSEIETQTGLPATPTPVAAHAYAAARPADTYQPSRRRSDWPIIALVGIVLVLMCCLAAAAIGWWQRERIPLLSGLLNQPTATSTPRPIRTPQPPSTRRPTNTQVPTEPLSVITATAAMDQIRRLCLLPSGRIDDGGFNALAWEGLQSAAAQVGARSIYQETTGYSYAEFRAALDQLLLQECDLIVGVGELTAEAIRQTAATYPQQKFMLLDASIKPSLPNVWSQIYASDQGAFLAGYLAASSSRTGKVGTFGGMDIPVVRTYMNGFAAGVSYYNANKYGDVQVLGWDISSQTGLFAGDFNNPQQGQILAKQLFNQGVDILFPVAGLTSYGAAAEATTRSRVYVIGVDTDWAASQAGIRFRYADQRGKAPGCQHHLGHRSHPRSHL